MTESDAAILFPYPSRQACWRELARDPVFPRIPPDDVPGLIDRTWEAGAEAARRSPRLPLSELLHRHGVGLELYRSDCVAAGGRRFGEYDRDANRIVLYMGALALWADANACAIDQASNIALAHEYFHFLECVELGSMSRLYQVRLLRIGGLTLLRSGVRALSEIGAHGFSVTYVSLNGKDELS